MAGKGLAGSAVERKTDRPMVRKAQKGETRDEGRKCRNRQR